MRVPTINTIRIYVYIIYILSVLDLRHREYFQCIIIYYATIHIINIIIVK